PHLAIEEGHQQGGDMCAVNVGVGHDNDLLIAQILAPVFVAKAAAERLNEILQFLIGADFIVRGGGDVQDLAAKRQDRLRLPVASLLGGAAGAVALDNKELRSLASAFAAIGKLAGKAQAACRRLAAGFLVLPATETFLGLVNHP